MEEEELWERERMGRRAMRWEAVGQRGVVEEDGREEVGVEDAEERAARLGEPVAAALLREE